MKEFKIDLHEFEGKVRELVSEAIQRHAFELGYPGWWSGGEKIKHTNMPYLFIETRTMTMENNNDGNAFMNANDIPISAADFLALTPEDVKDAPKDPEFKPFEQVLVRDYDSNVWVAHLYSHRDDNLAYIHRTVGDVGYHQCIPYEGNEHLLGTTEEPK